MANIPKKACFLLWAITFRFSARRIGQRRAPLETTTLNNNGASPSDISQVPCLQAGYAVGR